MSDALPLHYPTCFGCGPDAEFGMHLVARKRGEQIHASYTFSPKHSGAPGIAHGGNGLFLVVDVSHFDQGAGSGEGQPPVAL